jgi:hypothetical protein
MRDHSITREALERRFSHHPPPSSEVANRHSQVRTVLFEAADSLVKLTGSASPEQTLAIRKLEEAMMWANADIARKGADVSAAHRL